MMAVGYGATFDALNIWDLVCKVALNSHSIARPKGTTANGARSTRSSRARPHPVTASRNQASQTPISISTSYPTGSDPLGGSRTATSRTYETLW